MLSQGRRLPVLGRVSMDMTIIDLSAAPDLKDGDWVEAAYSPVEAAAQSGLSQYGFLYRCSATPVCLRDFAAQQEMLRCRCCKC